MIQRSSKDSSDELRWLIGCASFHRVVLFGVLLLEVERAKDEGGAELTDAAG